MVVSSGVKVNDECMMAVKSMDHNSNAFVILAIKANQVTGKQEVMLEDICHEDADHNEFLQLMPPNEGRFAIVRVCWYADTGRSESLRTKNVFIHWCPLAASVKSRFVYAASTRTVIDKFLGKFSTLIETGNIQELALEKIVKKTQENK